VEFFGLKYVDEYSLSLKATSDVVTHLPVSFSEMTQKKLRADFGVMLQ